MHVCCLVKHMRQKVKLTLFKVFCTCMIDLIAASFSVLFHYDSMTEKSILPVWTLPSILIQYPSIASHTSSATIIPQEMNIRQYDRKIHTHSMDVTFHSYLVFLYFRTSSATINLKEMNFGTFQTQQQSLFDFFLLFFRIMKGPSKLVQLRISFRLS